MLTSAGRIDIIDGQLRYDSFANLLIEGRPTVSDPALVPHAVRGIEGRSYTGYGFATLLTAWPLMKLGLASGLLGPERSRFLFSIVGAVLGAGAMALLLIFLHRLRVPFRRAVVWTLVSAFATLWWPLSVTVFDQVQHGFFLLLALFAAWRGARLASPPLVLLGGLSGGLLINFAESYALLLPLVGLAALTPAAADEARRAAFDRYVLFGMGCLVGLALWMGYNTWRFGHPLLSGRAVDLGALDVGIAPHPTFGNPLAGALGLLVSPGKGLLLYSPTVLLTLWGWAGLHRRQRWLALAVAATCAAHFALISSLAFFGGDWAWGPRYLGVLIPLLALTWPFIEWRGKRRVLAGCLIAAGLLVQVMAVSVDHQRFFFERDLPAYFWTQDWTYFRHSALLARPGEIVSLIVDGVPREADRFVPAPYPDAVTYAPFGPNSTNRGASRWMRAFQVFYLPRPWPLWMAWLPPEKRPFEPLVPTLLLILLGGLGGVGLVRLLPPRPLPTPPSG